MVSHTYHRHKRFPDSAQFDLLALKSIDDAPAFNNARAVVVATKIEDAADALEVLSAMRRLFERCMDKRVIYISTDAVFDGKRGMYSERDAPNPITAYGKTKAQCEQLLQEMVPNHCIVRTSYIYGYSLGHLDSRLTVVRKHVRQAKALYHFSDMYKSPVEVNQLAEIIHRLLDLDFRGHLHACGQRMSVHDFYAQSMAALGEKTERLLPCRIPEKPPENCLRDTSLDSALLTKLLGVSAIQLSHALGAYCVRQSAEPLRPFDRIQLNEELS